ncbi:cyclic nucleotide-binding domain-containing protein [Microvirga sp. STR05]|uniref:Cyclic nucleotide-binding domain-containing protein n=1 Tax=Hymenobacter duratus TaxID=2771356 RepID=A0ABR8JQH5_9BACT|nr:cyclic nucleotide-binding domain-containing protein [Hymenobacter duratus]MBD2716814.1 cyclic nucleotide-binding domain-containing protein [Hymenobacter duratus]MBR7951729.1 cyclic nucleotide-binding domain-containing protein [Microvirga sp. STR05]
MTLLERWQRLLGIRVEEGRTVGLFFLHNFLLGIGTILVYVAANVILLENDPERSLPLAYGLAALAMIVAGKVYAHFEHHLGLERVAVRVLLAVVALMAILGVLVAVGNSIAAAVAIMAGYRVIYLLTNLEFWGVSAVVFDVRQSRRLFSVISSGDMPAKALGAVLAILIHHHTDLLWLLLVAFAAYIGALLVLQATRRQHVVEARPAPRAARQGGVAPRLQQWFGASRLVLTMCLSMLLIAAVTTGIEYSFFVNVKHKFHDQATVMRYVGTVLVATYLVALLFKLLLSRVTLDQVGVRWMLVALPAIMLAGLLLAGGLWLGQAADSTLLLYFCGLYLTLEVLRRAVFDPVFLVLFQPLSPPERLQAHTLAKGLYEPLGMGLAGVLLYVLHRLPAWADWGPFVWMSLFMGGALLLLNRTYGHYLSELQHALSRRFTHDQETVPAPEAANHPSWNVDLPAASATVGQLVEALQDRATRPAAMLRLGRLGPAAVPALAQAMQTSTDDVLVRRLAQVCGHIRVPASRAALVALARQPQLFRREAALRALRYFDQEAADAPVFRALVQDEMHRARHLLRGLSVTTDPVLSRSLEYELGRLGQRLFGLLLQLYAPQSIAAAQRGVQHAARERQANALEILDNLIARPIYQALQALLEVAPVAEKLRTFDRVLGSAPMEGTVVDSIVEQGEAAFTDWTVSIALPLWHPAATTAAYLLPHLQSGSLLVRESAFQVLGQLAAQQPTVYEQLLTTHPNLPFLRMNHSSGTASMSAVERVALLQQTTLFAATPANVLSSIAPIMKEVSFQDGQPLFAKGDLGTSLFIVQAGEVGIFAGTQQLATFYAGDFFGELALLDAEPRSASAVARGSVVAFRIDQEDFYDVMEERGEVLRNIVRVLCQRLRRQNEKSVVE